MLRFFGSISKVEDQPDGTIKVYGIASSAARDHAGEIVSPDAMKAAIPDYSKFPALREMHQPIAAGKVTEAEVDQDGFTNIVAHVVDPVAVNKVKSGVYAGFSIGGKVTKRDPNDRTIITGIRLVEISLVDSPCNPDSVLSMWKADAMTEFTPKSADVVARARKLAKAAGTARFSDFIFEAAQELKAEHILKAADLDDVATGDTEVSADPAATVAEAAVEADSADKDAVATGEPETVDPAAGEAVEGAGEAKEAVAAADDAAVADPAAALADAIAKGQAAVASAAEPVVEPVSPFADFAKAAAALKSMAIAEPAAEEGGEPVHKSLWHVSWMADLLSSFVGLQQCVECEADSEGDNSPIPDALAEQIKAMGDTLVAMAKEEVAEVIASLTATDSIDTLVYIGDDMEMAASIVDMVKADEALIEKAGSRHSKADAAALQSAHDSLVKMGAVCSTDKEAANLVSDRIAELELEKAELAKTLADSAPAVEKIVGDFTATIDAMKGELSELRKRFEDEPLPAKTAGAAVVVNKALDSAGKAGVAEGADLTDEQVKKAFDELSEAERGQILLKIALARPQSITGR